MHVVGIIAEYNPFHLGHEFQIREARKKWGEDAAIVVVMSAFFVQRGEPAIASKWCRARSALLSGADLVLELPFTFSTGSADRFALGGVGILNQTGVVTDLFFGSECNDISVLHQIATVLSEEPESVSEQIRQGQRSGLPYAAARQAALCAYLNESGDPELARAAADYMSKPNSILGIEYLTALMKTHSVIRPSLLPRRGADYHDPSNTTLYPSATALRNIVTKNRTAGIFDISAAAKELCGKMPDTSLAELLSEYSSGLSPVSLSDYTEETISAIRRLTVSEISLFAHMNLQLAGRLKNAVNDLRCDKEESLHEALQNGFATKCFSGTRVQRALISLLVGQTADDLSLLSEPSYLRVLAFSPKGRYLLKRMRKTSVVPIINKASDFLEYHADAKITRSAELDLFAADLWGMKSGLPYRDEFRRSVVFGKGDTLKEVSPDEK